jgi:hypothetical protein
VTTTFYDRHGSAIAYSDDDVHVFLFDGEPVAYLEDDAMYSYPGELMGWFEDGWLRDKDGRCVAFSEQAQGGPPHSVNERRPYPALKQALPLQQRRDPRALRPIHSNAWSALTATDFFSHQRQRWPGVLGDRDSAG